MKYRAVYQPKQSDSSKLEVVSAYPNDSNVITTTGQEFLVGELGNLINQLIGIGVDISFFWKNGLMQTIEPTQEEVDISDYKGYQRKVFIHSMPVEQNQKAFWLNIVIRHFELGVHVNIPQVITDEFFTTYVDNSEQINGVGEYDYFKSLVDDGESMFKLQLAQIPLIDANGRFNYY